MTVTHRFDCGDIHCDSCRSERNARATARRMAARKGAETKARNKARRDSRG